MSVSSTVDSSEAADYAKKQYVDLSRKMANASLPKMASILPENLPNIKFEESEGIHVGNVIYNIHHHSPKTGNTLC